VVLHQHKDGTVIEYTLKSDPLVIPQENLDSCTDPNTGKIFCVWSEWKDPHSLVTNGTRSRKQFLYDALKAWKESETFRSIDLTL